MSLIPEQTEPDDGEDGEDLSSFSAPFHILRCLTGCWRCGQACKVTAITGMYQPTAEELGWDPDDTETVWDYDYSNDIPTEPSYLSSIRSLPEELLAPLLKLNPDFAMADGGYHNFCRCGARFGEFYLFNEPEGTFAPMEEDHFRAIEVYPLEVQGTFQIDCLSGAGLMGEIIEKGKPMALPE